MKFLVVYNTIQDSGITLAEQVSAILKSLDQAVELTEFSKDGETI